MIKLELRDHSPFINLDSEEFKSFESRWLTLLGTLRENWNRKLSRILWKAVGLAHGVTQILIQNFWIKRFRPKSFGGFETSPTYYVHLGKYMNISQRTKPKSLQKSASSGFFEAHSLGFLKKQDRLASSVFVTGWTSKVRIWFFLNS